MSLGPAVTAIQSYITTNFLTAPISWENEVYPLPDTPVPFVVIEINGENNTLVTMGFPANNTFIHEGRICAYCFTQSGIGYAAGYALADELSVLLQRKQISAPTQNQCVRTKDPVIRSGSQDQSSGNYYRTDVVIPFEFYYLG